MYVYLVCKIRNCTTFIDNNQYLYVLNSNINIAGYSIVALYRISAVCLETALCREMLDDQYYSHSGPKSGIEKVRVVQQHENHDAYVCARCRR